MSKMAMETTSAFFGKAMNQQTTGEKLTKRFWTKFLKWWDIPLYDLHFLSIFSYYGCLDWMQGSAIRFSRVSFLFPFISPCCNRMAKNSMRKSIMGTFVSPQYLLFSFKLYSSEVSVLKLIWGIRRLLRHFRQFLILLSHLIKAQQGWATRLCFHCIFWL